MKAAKHMMEKCKRSHTDPFMAMLEIRNTPTQGAGSSPAQRILNRCTKTMLPTSQTLLRPRGELHQDYDRLKLKHSQALQAYHYNRGAKDLPVLEEGDTVRMKPFRLGQKTWQRGTVTTRRNRVHLRKSNNPPDADTPESPDFDQADDQVRAPTPPATPRPTNPPSPLRRESAKKNKNVPERKSTRVSRPPVYLSDYELSKK